MHEIFPEYDESILALVSRRRYLLKNPGHYPRTRDSRSKKSKSPASFTDGASSLSDRTSTQVSINPTFLSSRLYTTLIAPDSEFVNT